MNDTTRYILIAVAILAAGFFLWYFSIIVMYIIAAAVLTLIGRPLVLLLARIRIGKFQIPQSLCALITVLFLWFIVISFFRVFIPVVASEAGQLSKIDVEEIVERLQGPIYTIEAIYTDLNISQDNLSFKDYIREKLYSFFNISIISGFFAYLASLLGDIFVAIFAISFITFFLLKEEYLLTEMILIFVPEHMEDNFKRALLSIKRLLSNYLIGVLIQLTGILLLVTIGMLILGFSFRQSMLIGLVASLLNIVPYLGPVIGSSLGVILGLAFNIHLNFSELLALGGSMIIIFIIIQVIDNMLFQPFIFSSSVNAHPLEIFLVIMMAASLAGIPGMILAIPVYTVIRVFAKEFFYNLRLVKKLTRKI